MVLVSLDYALTAVVSVRDPPPAVSRIAADLLRAVGVDVIRIAERIDRYPCDDGIHHSELHAACLGNAADMIDVRLLLRSVRRSHRLLEQRCSRELYDGKLPTIVAKIADQLVECMSVHTIHRPILKPAIRYGLSEVCRPIRRC